MGALSINDYIVNIIVRDTTSGALTVHCGPGPGIKGARQIKKVDAALAKAALSVAAKDVEAAIKAVEQSGILASADPSEAMELVEIEVAVAAVVSKLDVATKKVVAGCPSMAVFRHCIPADPSALAVQEL